MTQNKSTTEQIKKARRWQLHLQTWRESGKTQVEYCPGKQPWRESLWLLAAQRS